MLTSQGICSRYGRTPVLHEVSFRLERGHIGCILGPSGCGKTTLLRCIAGFERISAGEIVSAGVLLSGPGRHVPPEGRRIGMVFQDYALMPHLTALQNVEFGLRGMHAADRRARAMRWLEQVGLGAFAERFPHELSGGQQQRVAIARAMAPQPDLLLMDEPFSNLDAGLRQSLGREIRSLLKSLGATVLIATHDHDDAFSLADDVGVLRDGRLLQWDTAYRLYHRPADRFVAEFVGKGVWMRGIVSAADSVDIETGRATGSMTAELPVGTEVDLLLRPDDVVHDDDSELTAEVVGKQFRGSEFLYELRLPSGSMLLSSVPSHHDHAIGESIGIRLETAHMVVFPRIDRADDAGRLLADRRIDPCRSVG
ncbi:MAG TPA: ABC transporter ATP-binding protein [Woeseiaceae bacterium]|nr:ABC transporter ATP-binding protein [Woeseiaceae bacterium]